jgi:acetylornithine deacetylase
MIRLVGDAEAVKTSIAALVGSRADMEWGSHIPTQKYRVIEGFPTTTVAYTSDVPILSSWGTPLMYGPGSIHHAHTEEEHVSIEDLRSAVDAYARIARALLQS